MTRRLNNGENLLPMQMRGVSTATTYCLAPKDKKPWGWGAYCTVNDTTGELNVVSDWGSWSYCWGHKNFGGDNDTLTDFLAKMGTESHYVADKLTSHDHKLRRQFDPEATVKRLCKMAGEAYSLRRLSKEQCKELVAELREIACDDERDFVDRVYQIDNHDEISCEVWDHFEYEPTTGYLVLLHSILPGLFSACRQTVITRAISRGHTAEMSALQR